MQTSKKRIIFVVSAITAFASPFILHGYRGARNRLGLHAALQMAAASPFGGVVATQQEVVNCSLPFKNDKPPINTRIRAEAPDGSLSNDIAMADDATRKRVIARSDGRTITVYDHIRSTFTMVSPHVDPAGERRASMLNPATDCRLNFRGESAPGTIHKTGEEQMLGHRAFVIVSETPSIRRTAWRLPDVGCFEAQILTEYLDPKDPSKVQGNSLITTSKLVVGRPASTYFEAPPEYVERKPSDISVELVCYLLVRSGRPPAEARKLAIEKVGADAGQKRLDDLYARNQAYK